jgi:hypothetical protein
MMICILLPQRFNLINSERIIFNNLFNGKINESMRLYGCVPRKKGDDKKRVAWTSKGS